MKTKHTPGPWHHAEPFTLRKTPEHGLVRVRGIGNGVVHVGYASITPCNEHQAAANARLMAAAPELLAALETLVKGCDKFRLPNPVHVDQARAAIAKAK